LQIPEDLKLEARTISWEEGIIEGEGMMRQKRKESFYRAFVMFFFVEEKIVLEV